MTGKRIWGMFASCLVLSSGYAEPETNEQNQEQAPEIGLVASIQPRAEGAVWRYRTAEYEDRKVTLIGLASEKVVEVKKIEGATCFRVEQGWDNRTTAQRLTGLGEDEMGTSHYWEYWNEQGSYHFEEDFEDPKPPTSLKDFALTLKYPVEKGATYAADGSEWTVLDTKRKLKVAAGEFTCLLYQSITEDEDDPEFTTRDRLYMAPGVGMIRWEMDMRNDEGKWETYMRQDLLSYSLNQAKVAPEKEPKDSSEPDDKQAEPTQGKNSGGKK